VDIHRQPHVRTADDVSAHNAFVPAREHRFERIGSVEEAPAWYACYTRARHEKQVARLLLERTFETFLPTLPVKRRWKDRTKSVDWPLFPSYVFVRFDLQDLHRVLITPGVSTIVRSNGQPVPIREQEVENVRRFAAQIRASGMPEPERVPYPEKGDRVRVAAGPLTGIEGIVTERRGRDRVVIGLKGVGQGLLVNVVAGTVRRLPAPAGGPHG
jgi:transcription antitermination factor NusG